MYIDAYNLIREMLDDDEFKAFVHDLTGKNLTVIDSGPRVTTPCAHIAFDGSEVSDARNSNTVCDAQYTITFDMPFWNANGMRFAHELTDTAVKIFSSYSNDGSAVKRATLSMIEVDPEDKLWTVAITMTVLIFMKR